MADLRKATHGEGSTKGVNLAIIAYDNRIAKDGEGKVTTHYLDARIHPSDRRAQGQTTLALVTKRDAKSPSGFNNSARYSASQFDAIKTAAGDNVAPLTDRDGNQIGSIYGIKADLLVGAEGMIANTKSLSASDYSVGPDADGKDIQTQIFKAMKESKEARAADGVEATAEPVAEKTASPKPVTKKAPAKPRSKAASAKAAAASVKEADAASAEASNDLEPALG